MNSPIPWLNGGLMVPLLSVSVGILLEFVWFPWPCTWLCGVMVLFNWFVFAICPLFCVGCCGGVGPIWLCVKSPWLILLGGVVAGVEYTSLSSPAVGFLWGVFCCGVVVFGCVLTGVFCSLWFPSVSTWYVSGTIVICCSLGCVACLVISMALCLSILAGVGSILPKCSFPYPSL